MYTRKELTLKALPLTTILVPLLLILTQLTGCFADSLASPKLLSSEKSTVTHSKVLVQQAIEKNLKGEYKEALAVLNEAVRLNINDGDAYFNRALAYYQLNKKEQAIQDLTKAITLNNKFIEAYVNRGNIYLELQEYPKAVSDYKKVLSINPKNPLAHNNLGLVYMNLGEYEQATQYFKSAIALEPNYPDAYFNQGILYLELNQKQKAIASLTKAMTLAKDQENQDIYRAAQEELQKIAP